MAEAMNTVISLITQQRNGTPMTLDGAAQRLPLLVYNVAHLLIPDATSQSSNSPVEGYCSNSSLNMLRK